jgi:hypothetical protein
MNKREQLNTDIAIDTLVAINVNNILLLCLAKDKLFGEEFSAIQDQLSQMTTATEKLSYRSKQLDSEEGKS